MEITKLVLEKVSARKMLGLPTKAIFTELFGSRNLIHAAHELSVK